MSKKNRFFQKLAQIIGTPSDDLLPTGDFIQRDGKAVDISDPSVSLEEILIFFQERLPWLEILIGPDLPDDANQLSTKEHIFNHFAEILEAQHYEWTEAFKARSLKAT